MQPRVQLLDNVIDECGVDADKGKLQQITDTQSPRHAKELRSFLGLASYYRRFIKEFARTASPLWEKTLEKINLEWTSAMQHAFETLKRALITAPVLSYPDFTKPFGVATDASKRAVSAVLSLNDENGREHPIQYTSH